MSRTKAVSTEVLAPTPPLREVEKKSIAGGTPLSNSKVSSLNDVFINLEDNIDDLHLEFGDKIEELDEFLYDFKMDLSEEEKIRNFIINDLKWPAEKANILAPQWAKAHDFQGDVGKRTAKPVVALPDQAPELYVGNRGGAKGGENIIEFLRRVYGRYVEAEALTRPDLKRLDPKAYKALKNWLVANRELPSDLVIPTQAESTEAVAGVPNPNGERSLRASAALLERQRYKQRKVQSVR